MIDLQRTWVLLDDRNPLNGEIKIGGNKVTFPVPSRKGNFTEDRTEEFELRESTHLVSDCESCELRLSNGNSSSADFICHVESVGDREIPFLSRMTMELDGRGLVVIATYVPSEYAGLLDKDYKTRLYKSCNERVVTFMNPEFIYGGSNGLSMEAFFSMTNQTAPAANVEQKTDIAPWNCACGKQGNTGKFCGECGRPRQE